MGWRKRWRANAGTALLLLALVASGCDGFSGPEASDVASPDPVVAPEPTPEGALYGRVMWPDGIAAGGAGVNLWQYDAGDALRGAIAAASLGFFCLVPSDAFCPRAQGTSTSREGSYHFDPAALNGEPEMVVGAGFGGVAVKASFAVGTVPQRVPDLVGWDPTISPTLRGDEIEVAWSPLDDVPAGPTVSYAVVVTDGVHSAQYETVVEATPDAMAVIDGRWFEDAPHHVAVVAATTGSFEGQDVRYAYTSDWQRLPTGVVPPSRGADCLAEDENGALQPADAPCPLTDGDLAAGREVLLPGECSADGDTGCEPASHQRLCIDLGEARPVDLVVIRTPFAHAADDLDVQVSADGSAFRSVGGLDVDMAREAMTFPRPVEPAVQARIVCAVREPPWSFDGHILSEISVW